MVINIQESTTEELKQANSNRYRYDDNREYESNTEELKLVVIAEVGLCGVSGYVLYG